jgi:hypothetical protein
MGLGSVLYTPKRSEEEYTRFFDLTKATALADMTSGGKRKKRFKHKNGQQ